MQAAAVAAANRSGGLVTTYTSTQRLVRVLRKAVRRTVRQYRAADIRAGKGDAVAWVTTIGSAPGTEIDVSSAFVAVDVPDA